MTRKIEIEIKETVLEVFIQVIQEDFSKFLKDQNEEFYRDLIKKLGEDIKNEQEKPS